MSATPSGKMLRLGEVSVEDKSGTEYSFNLSDGGLQNFLDIDAEQMLQEDQVHCTIDQL